MGLVLVVTDMLNDFVREGAPLDVGPTVREIVPCVNERIAACRRAGGTVVFVADQHRPDDPEFALWPAHAVRGTEGSEVIAELDRRPEDAWVGKTRYSAYYGTLLEETLERLGATEVELAGVCTSICVLFTAMDLRNRDMPVTVYRRAVADFDAEAHNFALKHMERVLGVTVVG